MGNAPHQSLDAAEVLLLGGARWVHVVVASFCHGYGVWQAGGRRGEGLGTQKTKLKTAALFAGNSTLS